VRIGVVGDTHVGEALPALPAEVLDRLAGVDLVLHAGDLTEPGVLRDLGALGPVVAVQGDHDRDAGIDLPVARTVRVGGARIGLTHGRRSRLVEIPAAALTLARGRITLLGFHRAMRRRFGAVDCVVYGHLHLPFRGRLDGVDFFSPGAVYVPESQAGYHADSLRGRAYMRFRRMLPEAARQPSVGVIEVRPSGLAYRVIPLETGGGR
jgi:hypothetical protein